MTDFIAAAAILLLVSGALLYIRSQKKSGVKCIGCPSGGTCAHNCGGNCSDGAGCCSCHPDIL